MNSHLLQKIWQFPRMAMKRLMTGLLRVLLLSTRPARLARSGFVLPTTFLLVLMVLLTATALTYRSFTRSDQAITQREQKVIINAATPAIDRAKAKIEFLFQSDPRFPSGLPASDVLADLMSPIHDGETFVGYLGNVQPLPGGSSDPYTLPGETRLDINGDGDLDNAWSYNTDIDGDGNVTDNEIVSYSILVDDAAYVTENPAPTRTRGYVSTDVEIADGTTEEKANALVTRTGPLATTEASPICRGARAEGGWQVVGQSNNSQLQKNFQVNAFVANQNDANQTYETLEFQQSRIASRANKWGAWFRYDLEIYPGPTFNWNGAMHTDSNLFLHNNLQSYMVSSHNSCVYSQEASEITMSESEDINGDGVITPGPILENGVIIGEEFQGQAIKGAIKNDDYSGRNPGVHVFNGNNTIPLTNRSLTSSNDSVEGGKPSDIAVNPIALFTRDVTQHINAATWTRATGDGKWDDPTDDADNFVTRRRIFNDQTAKPFVDDFSRADDRWGPKPRYDSDQPNLDVTQVAAQLGDNITGEDVLTDPTEGLDGYWERQAIASGLRLIVGERLELGNANGWNSDPTDGATTGANDPLYPPNAKKSGLASSNSEIGGDHEYLQRRSLRDNLAAVQGMVVYHYQINGGEFPAACMALTGHPGTTQSIINSRTFDNYANTGALEVDFFSGKGTNGWEFYYPATFDTEAEFATEIASDKPLGIALRNLANFAGDPRGGAPSFKPVQDTNIHPAPYFNMWGDYSGLRRIFTDYLDAASPVAYDDLSPADKATLHSAACTMSLLAYNLKGSLDEFAFVNNSANATAVANLQTLATALKTSAPTLSTPQTDPTNVNATPLPLSEWLAAAGATPANETAALTTWGQVNRDRTLGFRIGKAFTYTLDPAFAAVYTAGNYELTCNPDDFVGIPTTSATYVEDRLSLALAFCSAAESPKYPSLYYLSPVIASHGQKGTELSCPTRWHCSHHPTSRRIHY
jgi:hypothetical protein